MMTTLRLRPSKLHDGEVELNGYKHAMVQIVAASIATNTPVVVANAPRVDDTFVLRDIINKTGGDVALNGHALYIDPHNIDTGEIDQEWSKKIHGSLYLIPAYSVHHGEFSFGDSGGCQIGSVQQAGKRPITHMIDVMERFGIECRQENDRLVGTRGNIPDEVTLDMLEFSDDTHRLTSPRISGATKTALLCATSLSRTTILNPYLKTDVQDLVRFLGHLNYAIELTEKSLTIHSPPETNDSLSHFYLTECVSEVMTYIALAVHTNIQLRIKCLQPKLIQAGLKHELELAHAMGVNLRWDSEGVVVKKNHTLRSIDIEVTNDSIQSDHVPFFVLMSMKADRPSRISEHVWRDRFGYVEELKKMGARLVRTDNSLLIYPSTTTIGGHSLSATDTRAAAILLLAAMTTTECVEIQQMQHLGRGYENLIETVCRLGAVCEVHEN